MRIFRCIISIIVFLLLAVNLSFAQDSQSEKAVKEAGAAGSHASKSAAHSISASGQVVSAAVAVPLMSAGASGAVSTQAGEGLSDAASTPIGAPLEISDETVTVGPPPDEAMKLKE